MEKKILFIFLVLCTLINTFANDKEFEIQKYNSELEKEILLISNLANLQYNLEIESFLEANYSDIPYRISYIKVDDNLYNNDLSGSNNFLNSELTQTPIAAIYLDLNSNIKSEVFPFNKKLLPDLQVTKSILNSLNIELQMARKYPLFLTSILENPPIIDKYLEWGVPLILVRGDISISKVLMPLTALDSSREQEHMYSLFPFFLHTFYLPGDGILIGISIFFLALIIIVTLFSKRIKFHLKHNIKYLFTLPLKLISVFIFYFISTLIIEYILSISTDSKFIYNFPISIFIIKNLILYFIYGICFHIIKDTSFSKSPHFYSYISFYISIGICILLSITYLPLALFQVWPITVTILFITSRNRSSKRLFLLLAPLILIITFVRYLDISHKEFVNLFISSRYRGNILLTILSAPYLFLQDSYHRFVTRRQNRIIFQKDIVLSVLLLTVTITYIAIILEL